MKKFLMVAAVLAATATSASAGYKQGHGPQQGYSNDAFGIQGVTIVVSCWRGPWREVIWDRYNGVFYDSLVAAGYSGAVAHSLANRICRDQPLVGNLQNRLEEVKQIIRSTPRR